jgi:hypothetical protein
MRSDQSEANMSRSESRMRMSGFSLLLHPSNTSVVTTTVLTALRSVTCGRLHVHVRVHVRVHYNPGSHGSSQ